MPRVVGDVLALAGSIMRSGVDAMRIYPAYLAAVEQLWHFIDGWQASSDHTFGASGSSLAWS